MNYNSSCSYSGHRIIPEAERAFLKGSLLIATEKLILSDNVDCFYCGGAMGFDMLAADAVINLREDYPSIKLIMALPCLNINEKWSRNVSSEFKRINELADKVIYVSEDYSPGCMHKRNRYLADNSLYLITYLRKKNGGTFYTRNYAVRSGSVIIDL